MFYYYRIQKITQSDRTRNDENKKDRRWNCRYDYINGEC